jgi:hypothetical protein
LENTMARYLAIGKVWLQHEGVAVPIMVGVGEEITFGGDPGAALIAIDAAGVEAKTRVARGRNAGGRQHDDLQEARYRVGLAGNVRKRLAAAEAALHAAA